MVDNIAFVFPGQGVQYIGMGKDLYDNFATVRYFFQEVSDIAHRDVADICFNGPDYVLNQPENTSLAIFTHSGAIAKIIESEYKRPLYSIGYAMAGHSMGQYTALYCADSVKLQDVVSMLTLRSNYMYSLGGRGGMAALVGLGLSEVIAVMADTVRYGYAEIANYNARDQFIISGQNDVLDAVVQLATQRGAVVAKRLNVSVPAHCALMERAAQLLKEEIKDIEIQMPKTNLFSNQNAQIIEKAETIKDSLISQMTSGVRWAQIMESFPHYNIKFAYEIGPGQVLSRLINRANVGCCAYKTNSLRNVQNILNKLDDVMKKR